MVLIVRFGFVFYFNDMQMSNETAKNKCKNFLSFLLELSAKQNQTVARNVKGLIQGLIDGKVNEENFADRLQKEVNSQPQPCLVGFLKVKLLKPFLSKLPNPMNCEFFTLLFYATRIFIPQFSIVAAYLTFWR